MESSHLLARKQPKREENAIKKVLVIGIDCSHDGGWGLSEMENLGEGNRFGLSALQEVAHRCLKMARKVVVVVEIDNQNIVAVGKFVGASVGDSYGVDSQ